MNILTKLVASNIAAAAIMGSLTIATGADEASMFPLPSISVQTDAAGARIVKEMEGQLVTAISAAKPVRVARLPSVVITEGDDIVNEEVVVMAERLPPVDNRVADATDTSVVPVRF